MRILILFFTVFSMNSFAGYMKKVDMEKCDGRKIYTHKSKCESSEGASCFKIVDGYDCNYFRVTAAMEDDLSSPKYTKSEVNNCGEYCQTLFDAGVTCVDSDESAILNLDLEQIYCSKQNGFNQVSVTKAREDASLKSSHNASKAAKTAAENVKMDALRAVKAKLESNAPLSDVDRDKVIEHLLRQIE